jgi:hypothetical protein
MNSDPIDGLLSDYFQAELHRRPWPAAPHPTEVTRTVQDSSGHARRVLAVSVAILLGGCWAISNSVPVVDRGPAVAPVPRMLPDSTADEKGVLPELRKGKARQNPPAGVQLP